MSDLTLSLLGIYNQDPTIMDEDHLILPEDLDRDTLLPMVLAESAELEVIYPDPATLKIVMPAWSRSRCPSWQRMLDALDEEYDPLHNYDRTETETIEDGLEEDISDTTTGNSSTARTGSTETTKAETETTEEDIADTGSSTTSGTSTGQVTGFNTQSFADNDKTVNSGTGSSSGSRDRDQMVTVAGTDSTESRDSETGTSRGTAIRDRDQSYNRDRTLRAYGNIGVTTSQEMLRAELEIRITDIYRLIADELISYFCLRIY